MSKTKAAPLRTLINSQACSLADFQAPQPGGKRPQRPYRSYPWLDITLDGSIRSQHNSRQLSAIRSTIPTFIPVALCAYQVQSSGSCIKRRYNCRTPELLTGPPWLPLDPSCWPTPPTSQQPSFLPEVREADLVTITEATLADWRRFSNWDNLVRDLAWVNRFITRSRTKPLDLPMVEEYLAPVEVDQARIILLKQSQQETFTALLRQLGDSKQPTGNWQPSVHS